jgi:hypothetical protein
MNNMIKMSTNPNCLKLIKRTYDSKSKTRSELTSLYFFLKSVANPNFKIRAIKDFLFLNSLTENNYFLTCIYHNLLKYTSKN